jgi:FkbM family methyltransferase
MTQIVDVAAYPFDDRDLPLEYERELTDIFITRLRLRTLGDVFLDIGAHLGTWTMRLAPYFKRVIAFEPEPHAYRALMKHLEMNGISNVTAYQKAVSNRSGTAKLILYDNPGHSALEGAPIERTQPTGECIVETVALDTLELPGRVDMVKVDTEAHELEVLEGATNVLRRDKPRYCLENHSPALREACIAMLRTMDLADGLSVWPVQHRHHAVFGGYTIRT